MVDSGLFRSMLAAVFVSLLVSAASAQKDCSEPQVVRNLKAHNTTNTTVLLTWEEPESTRCADHYRLNYCSYLAYHAVDQCSFKSIRLPLNSTHYELTKLEPCRYNLLELYTVAADGKENYTYLELHTGGGDPPKVKHVNVTAVRASYVILGWTQPEGYDAQCYPGFKVCYTTKGSSSICGYTVESALQSTYVTVLSPCTEYNVSVQTVDGDFQDDRKTSAITSVSIVTAPQAPSVSAKVHNHTAHLSWSSPDNLSMSCASNFLVRNCIFPHGVLFPTECNTLSTTSLPLNASSVAISGLDGCAKNYISLNLVGKNGYSSVTEVAVVDPQGEMPEPLDAKVSYASSSEIVVDFYKGSNDCVDSYRACLLRKGEKETCKYTNSTFGAAFKHLELTPCSNYTLHFAALSSSGRSSKNFTTTFLTGPANAPNQTVKPSAFSALFSWNLAPSTLQCGAEHKISWQGILSEEERHTVLPLNSTSYNVTGLSQCTEYSITFYTKGRNQTYSNKNTVQFYTTLGELGPITKFNFAYTSSYIIMDVVWPHNSYYCMDTYTTCWYPTGDYQSEPECGERVTGWSYHLLTACINYTVAVNATMKDGHTTSGSTTFMSGPGKVMNLTVDEHVNTSTATVAWVNPPTNNLCTDHLELTTTWVSDGSSKLIKLPADATNTTVAMKPCGTYLLQLRAVGSSVQTGDYYLARYTTACSSRDGYLS